MDGLKFLAADSGVAIFPNGSSEAAAGQRGRRCLRARAVRGRVPRPFGQSPVSSGLLRREEIAAGASEQCLLAAIQRPVCRPDPRATEETRQWLRCRKSPIVSKAPSATTAAWARASKFDLKETGVIHIDGGSVTNEDKPADLTMTLSLDDLLAIGAGSLDPTMAVMTGKLKLSDMGTAMALQSKMAALFAKMR